MSKVSLQLSQGAGKLPMIELVGDTKNQNCVFCHTCGGDWPKEGGVFNIDDGWWGYGDACAGTYKDENGMGAHWAKICCKPPSGGSWFSKSAASGRAQPIGASITLGCAGLLTWSLFA